MFEDNIDQLDYNFYSSNSDVIHALEQVKHTLSKRYPAEFRSEYVDYSYNDFGVALLLLPRKLPFSASNLLTPITLIFSEGFIHSNKFKDKYDITNQKEVSKLCTKIKRHFSLKFSMHLLHDDLFIHYISTEDVLGLMSLEIKRDHSFSLTVNDGLSLAIRNNDETIVSYLFEKFDFKKDFILSRLRKNFSLGNTKNTFLLCYLEAKLSPVDDLDFIYHDALSCNNLPVLSFLFKKKHYPKALTFNAFVALLDILYKEKPFKGNEELSRFLLPCVDTFINKENLISQLHTYYGKDGKNPLLIAWLNFFRKEFFKDNSSFLTKLVHCASISLFNDDSNYDKQCLTYKHILSPFLEALTFPDDEQFLSEYLELLNTTPVQVIQTKDISNDIKVKLLTLMTEKEEH